MIQFGSKRSNQSITATLGHSRALFFVQPVGRLHSINLQQLDGPRAVER